MMVIAFSLTPGWLLGTPGRALAADPIATSTASTFTLIPASSLVRVTVTVTITNNKPSVTSGSTTTYYYVDSSDVQVDPQGTNFHATTPGGSARVSVKAGKPGYFSIATLGFPRILYHQTRSITLTYDMAGGTPRSGSYTRANAAYARFCVFLSGAYLGSVDSMHFVVPSTFKLTQYYGTVLAQTNKGTTIEMTVAATPQTKDSGLSQSCFEAIDLAGYVTSDFTSASGVQLRVSAWPNDPDWLNTMADAAGGAVDDLENVIGKPPTSTSISIQEVAGAAIPGFGGANDVDPGIVLVSEDAKDPLVAVGEMAHLWFNDRFSPESWLTEGYAAYLARLLVPDSPDCGKPDDAVLEGISLSFWTNLPRVATPADVAAAKNKYDTACWVVTEVSNRMSQDDLKGIYAAAAGSEIPYLGAGPAEKEGAGAIGWRRWLDLVDERALAYDAGDQDWLQNLLASVGVTQSSAELSARSAARASYHRLLAEADPWAAPLFVREAMTDWRFDEADAGIELATKTADLHQQAVAKVPELDAGATVEKAFEAANDEKSLQAANGLADAELKAATVVADAVKAAHTQRGPVEAVGLLGDDVAKDANGAVVALVAGELDTATTGGTHILAATSGATTSGALRLGGVGAVVLIGGGSFWLLRRRRGRATATAPAAPAEPSEATGDEEDH